MRRLRAASILPSCSVRCQFLNATQLRVRASPSGSYGAPGEALDLTGVLRAEIYGLNFE